MTPQELIEKYPRLYHMAHLGSWPAIRAHGLLSASALLDLYKVPKGERVLLEKNRRPDSVRLAREGLPGAMLRDQKPMSDSALKKCLQDKLAPTDWYETLNGMSFFWLSQSRIWRLLKAKAYRDSVQTVLTIDSGPLISKYKNRIRLSPINSGSTIMNPQPRGKSTFSRIEDFPFAARAKSRAKAENVVELVIDHSVPDLADYVLAVHEVKNDKIVRRLWCSSNASDSDHP